MKNGIIEVDSKEGKRLGFTSNKFYADSYLWVEDDTIFISMMISKEEGKGYFTGLLKNIERIFSKIIVPIPSNKMFDILRKRGFVLTNLHNSDECFEAMTKGLEVQNKETTEIQENGIGFLETIDLP